MNPKDMLTRSPASSTPVMSEFERELIEARTYFGDDFPGNEGLTCQVCGAAVNLGWAHIRWHKGEAA